MQSSWSWLKLILRSSVDLNKSRVFLNSSAELFLVGNFVRSTVCLENPRSFVFVAMGSRKEEERNEKIIRGLMKLPPNRRCINCNGLVNGSFFFVFSLSWCYWIWFFIQFVPFCQLQFIFRFLKYVLAGNSFGGGLFSEKVTMIIEQISKFRIWKRV